MPERVACACCRWDGCFIRLLDGMLQAGALAGADMSDDYQLRIPTRIRALSIGNPSPGLPLGSDGAHFQAQQLLHITAQHAARAAVHAWELGHGLLAHVLPF